jgi:hypothetical protein
LIPDVHFVVPLTNLNSEKHRLTEVTRIGMEENRYRISYFFKWCSSRQEQKSHSCPALVFAIPVAFAAMLHIDGLDED